MTYGKNTFLISLLTWVIFSLVSIASIPTPGSDIPANPKEKIIVGGDFDYKPFTWLDDNGEAKGFDVDVIKYIAEKYNWELEFRFTQWNKALENLDKGEVDILISILYTEQRDTIYDFTIPYNEDYYGIFVRKDSEVKDISDLSQKQIIALEGDASVTRFINPMALFRNTTLVNSLPEAINLLSEGEGDAVLAPYSIGMEAIEDLRIRNVKVVGPSIMPILYRFAVKKGDSQLLSLLNEGIDQVKVSGKKKELLGRWDFHKRNEVSVEKVIRYVGIGLIPLILIIALLFLWTKTLRRSVAEQTQTLQEKTTKLEELNATKDKLFSVIAHDLKSPFNSILGLSELLLNDNYNNDSTRSKKLLRYIHSSAKNTLSLTENLLSWAKSQTGQMKFVPKQIRLKEVVDEVIGIVDTSAKVKDISVDYTQMPDIYVYAEINMLKSILYNLISNAIKFSHANEKVRISGKTEENKVEIIISDKGVGMSVETKRNLFHIDSGSTRGTANEDGSGLGLILCKEFVEKHGGNIWVESEIGSGSHFYFTIPLNQKIYNQLS
ncbi:MAG: transporter substrate-binding domain-containing protein [Bacteroidales bacterium]